MATGWEVGGDRSMKWDAGIYSEGKHTEHNKRIEYDGGREMLFSRR